MTVSVVKVRRTDSGYLAYVEGHNEKGHEVLALFPWDAVKGLADDLEHGEAVHIKVSEYALVSVKNPRMRRTA